MHGENPNNSLFGQIITFENIYLAFKKAVKGKRTRDDVSLFLFDLEEQLLCLQEELTRRNYQASGYRQFTVYEPKPRIISVAPFRDRIVHHSIMNVCDPLFEQAFSASSFACRKGKGVHAAVNRYQQLSKNFAYVLKTDLKYYFPSINHKVLIQQVKALIKDDYVFRLFENIIHSGSGIYAEGAGLPIGNLTSQVLANLYLSDIDHWLESLAPKIKFIRYVDDIFILSNNKKLLWDTLAKLKEELFTLKLVLRPERTNLLRTSEKVDVLGYQVTPYKRWLRRENGFRFQRRLKKMTQQYAKNSDMNVMDYKPNIMSWLGHAKHAETQGLYCSIASRYPFVRESI